MKTLYVIGGTFSLPHWGHFFQVSYLLNTSKSNLVYVIPTGERVDKENKVSSFHRWTMIHLLFSPLLISFPKRLLVSSRDIFSKNTPTYTLWKNLEEEFSSFKIVWCIGEDLVDDIENWENGDKLLQKAFLIFKRPGFKAKRKLENSKFAKMSLIDASSSKMIENLKRGGFEWKSHTSQEVSSYVFTNNLFKN